MLKIPLPRVAAPYRPDQPHDLADSAPPPTSGGPSSQSNLSSGELSRLEDGNAKAKDLPDYTTIIRRRDLVSVSIAVDVVGVEVKCFFWGENELTLDLRPEDVDSAEKAQGVFDLMKAIANTLNKRVLLTAENGSATRQWSEEYAICMFDPPHVQP